MVCLNFEVCDRVTVEMGLWFSFEYWGLFKTWIVFLFCSCDFLSSHGGVVELNCLSCF